jgi:DNA-3-methyladenine glycosylase II
MAYPDVGTTRMLSGLTQRSLLRATRTLTARDPDLAGVVETFGPPPLWAREPGFPTLIHIILEQQVSLASARAAYRRLVSATGQLVPERFLALRDGELKTIGFSRQKITYGRALAQAILVGRLDLALIETLDDTDAKARLTAIKGIGPWTADIYLLMGLRRPDTWPNGDLALAIAAQRVKRLRKRPTPEKLQKVGEAWRPWRAVAARILWHYYLSNPRQHARGRTAVSDARPKVPSQGSA